jgi:hypothetical protein
MLQLDGLGIFSNPCFKLFYWPLSAVHSLQPVSMTSPWISNSVRDCPPSRPSYPLYRDELSASVLKPFIDRLTPIYKLRDDCVTD